MKIPSCMRSFPCVKQCILCIGFIAFLKCYNQLNVSFKSGYLTRIIHRFPKGIETIVIRLKPSDTNIIQMKLLNFFQLQSDTTFKLKLRMNTYNLQLLQISSFISRENIWKFFTNCNVWSPCIRTCEVYKRQILF